MMSRKWFVAALLLFSGMCALIYQVAWLREFRLVFGGSTTASAAVLAIFMGGLGFGNLLLGRYVDRHDRPMRLYAWLEFGIAACCAVSPFLIDLTRLIYASLGGQEGLGVTGATLVRLIFATLVLGLPTLLMGGTLPAAAKAVTSSHDENRRDLSLVYGLNTLGAVVGSLLSTFWLLQAFGTRATLWTACVVNVALALLAFRAGQALPPNAPAALSRQQRKRHPKDEYQPVSAYYVYFSAMLVGCIFLLMELVWYRMLGPILGGSTYTFGLILAVALAGIGCGGALYGVIFQRRPTALGFATTCGLQAAFMGLPFALGDRLALLSADLQAGNSQGFGGVVFAWSIVASIVIFPAALISGLQFPVLIALLGRGDEHVAEQVGAAFAWNTVGCIAGSLLGGFGLLPLLTAPGVWCVAVIALSLLALFWTALAYRQNKQLARLWSPLSASACALVCIWFVGPTAVWRHSGIGAGRAPEAKAKANEKRQWMNSIRRQVVWEAEGVESSIAIRCENSYSFYVNGKSDGNAIGDANTQIMLGMVGATLHPNPQQALVVGLGTGETAGWIAALPEIQHVDIVELEPRVVTMAELCAAVNHDVLHNPKARLIINDAREVLTTTPQHYDLIVSEPSNPYRAGVASLFTREFYQAAQARLHDDGLFCQWLQAYEVDETTVGVVVNTLRSVFSHVELWETGRNDLLLIASAQPPKFDIARLRQRTASEPFAAALRYSWRGSDVECLLSGYLGGDQATAAIAELARGAINTDDRNQLEFAFARSLGSKNSFATRAWRNKAFALDDHRPAVTGGEIDWEAVIDLYALTHVFYRDPVPQLDVFTPAQQTRVAAYNANLQKQHAEALKLWDSQPRKLRYSTELAVMTNSALIMKDPRALEFVEALQKLEPAEADGIAGLAALRLGDLEAAAKLTEMAITSLHSAPWPRFVGQLGLLAEEVGKRDPAAAKRLYALLSQPYAVNVYDEDRLAARLQLGRLLKGSELVAAIEAYEPYPKWEESFLALRSQVYNEAQHPLASRARRELQEFKENER